MFRFLKIIVLAGILMSANFANAHKFYMSICDMEYNEKSASLQIVIKFFADDLEKVLEQKNDLIIKLGTDEEYLKTDSLLTSYLNTNFQIKQSGSLLYMDYIGKEVDQDYAWVYLEVTDFDPLKKHVMINELLTEQFEEQMNKVNYSFQSKTNSFSLHKHKPSQEF